MMEEHKKEFVPTMESLPAGYVFKPSDDQLVVHYLKRKVYKKPLPSCKIKEIQFYNYDLETLIKLSEETNNKSSRQVSEWYFFTPRDRKYGTGSRPRLVGGNGFWKAIEAKKPVKFKGNIVGFKKKLAFYNGKPAKGDKTNWIMQEFVLSNPPATERAGDDDQKLDDWVLCKVYKLRDTKLKFRKSEIVD
ncbi:NAC domain-containing protein 68-like [Durio zibethinus]|uniref:NAC domain-containing protein 68-like n=1 Tax=Durio zibethinus TaxID=66656 RepID=A0A6P5WMF3_DURZI|nr:NAC domain-containing protein 68-like [Durio zibethinus]